MRRTSALIAAVTVCALAPATLAGFANFGEFEVDGIRFSSTGVRGGPFVQAANPFQFIFGNNFPVSPSLIQEFGAEAEFDSYVAFGGSPSTSDTAAPAPPETPSGFDDAAGFFDSSSSLQGAVFSDGESFGRSQVNPLTGRQSFFFARLTLPVGEEVFGDVIVEFGDGSTRFLSIEQFDPEIPDITFRGFSEFKVISQKTRKNVELPTRVLARGNNSDDTAFFDVFDLYVEFVPAPGAGVVFAMAGVLGTRRRRRG